MDVALFERAADNQPQDTEISPEDFLNSFLDEPALVEGVTLENAKAIKNQGAAWGGKFSGTRSKANFVSIPAVVYDLDGRDGLKDGVELAGVLDLLEDMHVSYAIHSTFSSGFVRPCHKLRVVIPTTRPVNAEEYVALWDKYAEAFDADSACRSPERIHFAPRIPVEHKDHYFCKVVTDRPFLAPEVRRGDLNRERTSGVGRDWLAELRTTATKDDTLHRAAFRLGKEQAFAGSDLKTALADVWGRCEAALKDNPSPVSDWAHALDNCTRNATAGFSVGLAEMADVLKVPEKSTDQKLCATAERQLEKFRKQIKQSPRLNYIQTKARAMGTFIAQGAIDEGVVYDVLLAAGLKGTTPADELQTAIQTAIGAGKADARPGAGDDWMRALTRNKDGEVTTTDLNISHTLRNHPDCKGLIYYDVRSGSCMVRRLPPWRCEADSFPAVVDVDSQADDVMFWLYEVLGVPFARHTVKEGLVHTSMADMVDRFKEYLEDQVWDQKPRLSTWLESYVGAKDEHAGLVGRKWLIGAVARTFTPGCQMKTSLLFTGAQDAGKSKVFRTLLPDDRLFSDQVKRDGADKDQTIRLSRLVIVELAELAWVAKQSLEDMKAFLSCQGADARGAYMRADKYWARTCVFASTTNETSDFLTDPTGDARFWVVRTGLLRFEELERDRDQLWAEAVAAYKSGEAWHLTEQADKDLVQRGQAYATRVDIQVQELTEWRTCGIPEGMLTSAAEDRGESYVNALEDQLTEGKVPRYLTVEQVCTAFGLDRVRQQYTALGWLKAAGYRKSTIKKAGLRRITPYYNPDQT
jgi:predicted P-loop ATPase